MSQKKEKEIEMNLEMVEVYLDEQGRLMAKCPNSINDLNVWVWCSKCQYYAECFGKATFHDLYQKAQNGRGE